MKRPSLKVPTGSQVVAGFAVTTILFVAVVIGGLAAGYRPVVIQTGSMGDTAPPKSLIIAAPRDGGDVAVGDIVVMRRPNSTPITHRVIEIETEGAARFAITQGDANEAPDAAPYDLDGEQLVSRWIFPGLGGWLQKVFQPGPALALVALATLVIAFQTMRRIWSEEPGQELGEVVAEPVAPSATEVRTGKRRRRMALVAIPLVGAMTAGVSWALFNSSEVDAGNVFGSAACFDAQLGSVQNGETIHAVNGTVTVPIAAVNPASSFVLASIRSNSNESADSAVQVALAGGGTTLELVRFTDNGAPPAITVAWSVVEYSCGLDVQHGTVNGDGTSELNVTIPAVDPAASFALATTAPAATATDFDGDDLFVAELTSATNLRIRSAAGAPFSALRSFAWQVITFADPGDIDVEIVDTTLGVGATTAAVPLASPADPSNTFLLTSVTSSSTGPDIGERVVRAHLSDANTLLLSRGVGGEAIGVHVQVVTLLDGSTVRHGTIDFSPAQPARTVSMDPVDVTRSTAISTVAIPGASAGGQTDHIADDTLGEASATFTVTDPETVSIARDATASAASFGWQVIEWAGPRWWDPGYTFRQRIDVDTDSAAAPDAYTVPLTLDHAALVSLNLTAADGSDLRVLRWDGATWTELDRVLDDAANWNQVNTTLWFRTIDPIGTFSTSSYWLYFGNPAPAAPAEDPEAVYLLTENFESGTLGDFEDRTGNTGWYAADPWSRRIPLTINSAQVSAPLAQFPALVTLTSADLAANAQADAADIRFTASDGVTPLDHEIESWDSLSGALTAWVRVPAVASATDTTIYLYYGANNADDQQSVHDVWNRGHEAVWHLAEDPSGPAPQVDDSSPSNHDGLSSGSMTAGDQVVGLAGGAVDFDGSDDTLQVDSFDLSGATQLTMSAWVRLDASASDATIFAKAADASTQIFELAMASGASPRARLLLDSTIVEVSAGAVSLGAWHHVAATWDGTTFRLFVDGTELDSAPASGTLDADPTMPVTVGNLIVGGSPIDGALDEARIVRGARSASWVAAEYANQALPGSFITAGAPEAGTWFSQGTWTYRKPIVVDATYVATDLDNFALLVQITDPEIQGAARADGFDIVFTSDDGTTRFDHVVEHYDSGSGSLSAWVRIPKLSAADNTTLFAYYGNATATDQQDPVAVFGPNADLTILGAAS